MHTTLVINLILTICLCDKNSLHNSILYIINNVIALKTDAPVGRHQKKLINLLHYSIFINNVIALPIDAPVGKHQRESVSGCRRFSKIHVFHVKIFDSSHGFSANQKDMKSQILTQAPPTLNNGINRLSHPVP